jgi:hypothetical protein
MSFEAAIKSRRQIDREGATPSQGMRDEMFADIDGRGDDRDALTRNPIDSRYASAHPPRAISLY